MVVLEIEAMVEIAATCGLRSRGRLEAGVAIHLQALPVFDSSLCDREAAVWVFTLGLYTLPFQFQRPSRTWFQSFGQPCLTQAVIRAARPGRAQCTIFNCSWREPEAPAIVRVPLDRRLSCEAVVVELARRCQKVNVVVAGIPLPWSVNCDIHSYPVAVC